MVVDVLRDLILHLRRVVDLKDDDVVLGIGGGGLRLRHGLLYRAGDGRRQRR